MAKKDFGNIGKNTHMGGGIGNLIPDMDKKEAVAEIVEKKVAGEESPKTFFMLHDDHKFLQDYSRHMAFHKKTKYPVKTALHDAIQLLREKHPEIGNN